MPQKVKSIFSFTLGGQYALIFENSQMVGSGALLNFKQSVDLGNRKLFAIFQVRKDGDAHGVSNGLEHTGSSFQHLGLQIGDFHI